MSLRGFNGRTFLFTSHVRIETKIRKPAETAFKYWSYKRRHAIIAQSQLEFARRPSQFFSCPWASV